MYLCKEMKQKQILPLKLYAILKLLNVCFRENDPHVSAHAHTYTQSQDTDIY